MVVIYMVGTSNLGSWNGHWQQTRSVSICYLMLCYVMFNHPLAVWFWTIPRWVNKEAGWIVSIADDLMRRPGCIQTYFGASAKSRFQWSISAGASSDIVSICFNRPAAITHMVGGLEHFLVFHILGIVIPTDFHIFQRGRSTTNQIILNHH